MLDGPRRRPRGSRPSSRAPCPWRGRRVLRSMSCSRPRWSWHRTQSAPASAPAPRGCGKARARERGVNCASCQLLKGEHEEMLTRAPSRPVHNRVFRACFKTGSTLQPVVTRKLGRASDALGRGVLHGPQRHQRLQQNVHHRPEHQERLAPDHVAEPACTNHGFGQISLRVPSRLVS